MQVHSYPRLHRSQVSVAVHTMFLCNISHFFCTLSLLCEVFTRASFLKNTLNVPVSANLPFVILMKAAQSDRNVDRKTTEWRLVLGLIKMSSTQSGPKGPSHESLKSFLRAKVFFFNQESVSWPWLLATYKLRYPEFIMMRSLLKTQPVVWTRLKLSWKELL